MDNGRFYLAGLTSFSSGCGDNATHDVFARVTNVLGWIHDTIEDYPACDESGSTDGN